MRSLLLLALVIAFPAVAGARSFPFQVPQPLLLRLEGHFAADRAAARVGADPVSMRVDGEMRWFAVTLARTFGGDQPLSGRDVLNAIAPIEPNLIAVGSADLRHALAGATDGTPLTIEGLVDRGSRSYLLRKVTLPTPPDPSP